MLQVRNIEKYYGSKNNVTKALDRVSFEVDDGEFIAIMGASGSGKTTLLNCISTIDTVSAGDILLDGESIAALPPRELARFRRERLGFVFQDCNLLDTLTAFENIALALTILKTPAGEIEGRVQETARLLDITPCLNKFPYQLSGGERQRVAAARAIITRPALVLADEPTGALDSKSARLLLDRFEELNGAQRTTILMVTHDAFTASYCRRILFIKDGRPFTELVRGASGRKDFFARIIEVVTLLGGDSGDVL